MTHGIVIGTRSWALTTELPSGVGALDEFEEKPFLRGRKLQKGNNVRFRVTVVLHC